MNLNNFQYRCIDGGETYPITKNHYTCPIHEKEGKYSDLIVECNIDGIRMDRDTLDARPYNMLRFHELLPINPDDFVTLGEGWTELNRLRRLESELGLEAQLFAKYEHGNPTGSFKDRGMSVGVTRGLEIDAKYTVCASTGNTAASLAAYSAKAGITSIVFIPRGTAKGKIVQAAAYGAKIIGVDGNFDDALKVVRNLKDKFDMYLLNSLNPMRLVGQRTMAYEICTQLGYSSPDVVIVPVGNGGNLPSIWAGFKTFRDLGLIDKLPMMIGVQAEGAAPIYDYIINKREKLKPIEDPKTVASAIKIGDPANYKLVKLAIEESNGIMETVNEDEIQAAHRWLPRNEGLFVEAASATPIAAMRNLAERGLIEKDNKVILVATGSGLKQTELVDVSIEYTKPDLEVMSDLLRRL